MDMTFRAIPHYFVYLMNYITEVIERCLTKGKSVKQKKKEKC